MSITLKSDVIIIGAGLSGMTAAFQLLQQVNPPQVVVFEARNRIGGRIYTVEEGLDLGPTWFWSENKHVKELLSLFRIDFFEQYETGHHLFQSSVDAPVKRFASDDSYSVPSYRFTGGTVSLVNALKDQLNHDTIQFQKVVKCIQVLEEEKCVQVQLENGQQWQASHVIVTLPPHLAATTLSYDPPLPATLQNIMQSTPTWMGQAMKVALRYSQPFWRDEQLSGMAVSHTGPVQQFHDASNENVAGLFGWVTDRGTRMTTEARRQAVLRQVVQLFGPQAAVPLAYHEMNWGEEPLTNNAEGNPVVARGHPTYGHAALQVPWEGRVWWATTEASHVSGGYLDGAICIGRRVAQAVAERLKQEVDES
ncbi:monoamine oxidase [Fistulifera solaris]|uniref:monoamine oxidase n=1 Tax=Fistulifera solaris TaxID=1519565 RepID=A0A1Z5KUC5_FISSO|nr:monoamine oxidase [Fistulifera solaris]|eukprot:GAX29588.1 monoamine oxidase [Fistulifera solaris]